MKPHKNIYSFIKSDKSRGHCAELKTVINDNCLSFIGLKPKKMCVAPLEVLDLFKKEFYR